MTFDQLSEQLDRLHGLPFPPADYRTHWEGLSDMPHEVLAFAVGKAAKFAERFPSPFELRQYADTRPIPEIPDRPTTPVTPVVFTHERLGDKRIVVDRVWQYYCEDCSDSGQLSMWCNRHPGSEVTKKPWQDVVQPCTLKKCQDNVLYPHEWVDRCHCWHTNPALKAKRDAQAKYAEQRGSK